MLSPGTNEKNENKSTTTEMNNNQNTPVYPTLPITRRRKPQTVPEYTSRNLNRFFNPNLLSQSPIDIGLSVSWRAALIVGVVCAIGPVSMGLLNAIMPSLTAGAVAGTLGAGGKFAYDQYQECTKTRKGPSSSI